MPSSPSLLASALLASAIALAVTATPAQTQFFDRVDTIPQSTGASDTAVFGDIDGDGDLDLLMPTNIQSLAIRLNDGQGRFATTTTVSTPFPTSAVVQIEGGDLDGDGDFDAILHVPNIWTELPYAIATNDGTGVFSVSPLRTLPQLGAYFKLTDLDLDGDLDMVVSSNDLIAPITGYTNDGANNFSLSTLLPTSPGGDHGFVPTLGDLNNDGRDDIVALGSDRYLYVSTPGGYVDITPPLLLTLTPTEECIADFDGDGNHDLLVANQNGAHDLLLGDGTGSLTRGPTPFVSVKPIYAMDPVDIDNDGDIDLTALVSTQSIFSEIRLFVNDGSGVFTDETAARMPNFTALNMYETAGDIDGDGDIDLYLGSGFWAGQNHTLINRHSQLSLDTPLTLGATTDVRFSRQLGYGTGTGLGLAVYSTETTPTATPYGILHLDTATATTLPFVLIPSGPGEATTTLTVPMAPSLAGFEVVFQGIITDVNGAEPLRLSNFVRARVQ